jgi:curved DNA-binding protein CbpA
LELSKKNGKRQGITLVELGYLSPKELFIALREQIREIILDGFLCEEGTFRFKETHSFSDIIRIKIEIDSLIQEGLMRKEAKRRKKQDLFIQQVNELYEKFINQSLSYYDILDVGVNAPLSEIKKAYLRMVRQYHPDMSYDLPSPDVKKKIEELFTFINNAYKTLSDETKREQYNASLLKRTPDTIRGEKTKAEEQFKRGVMELKAGNFWGAADFLRGATRIDPQKAIYWAYLSMALINIPKRTKEAEQAILNAIRLEPHNAKYYVHLGNIYLKAGLNKRAVRQFEIALSWDPTNYEAHQKLEVLKNKR